ncbi:MAG TPA: hypothetical protein VF945_21390 [Polyangia bacterium]
MRLGLLLLLTLAWTGCGSDKNTNGNDLSMTVADDMSGAGGAGGGGGGGAGGGGGGGNTDGFVITDGGVVGATCKTACDCMPGLGCFGGKCTAGNAPVYCCGSTDCPSGAFCESMTGGFGRCGFGAPDLAGFDKCTLINCNGANGTARCMTAGCTMCVANGNGGMSCAK